MASEISPETLIWYCQNKIPGYWSRYNLFRPKISSVAQALSLAIVQDPYRPMIKMAKQWRKKLYPGCMEVENLDLILVAIELHLSMAGEMQSIKDFLRFAKNNRLSRWLNYFNHRLVLNNCGEIIIKYQGELRSWSSISRLIPLDDRGHMLNHHYGRQGIELGSLWKPGNLIPYHKLSDYQERYLYQIVAYLPHKNKISVDGHYFFLLQDNRGNLYSGGIGVRKPALNWYDIFNLYSNREPQWCSPDFLVPEKCKYLHKLTIEITENQFDLMISTINKIFSSATEKTILCDAAQNNCSYIIQQLNIIAGIDLGLSMTISEWLTEYAKWYFPQFTLPNFVHQSINKLTGLVALLGGRKINFSPISKLREEFGKLNFEANQIYHPWKLAKKIIPQVEKWRNQDIVSRQYKLPGKFLLSHHCITLSSG